MSTDDTNLRITRISRPKYDRNITYDRKIYCFQQLPCRRGAKRFFSEAQIRCAKKHVMALWWVLLCGINYDLSLLLVLYERFHKKMNYVRNFENNYKTFVVWKFLIGIPEMHGYWLSFAFRKSSLAKRMSGFSSHTYCRRLLRRESSLSLRAGSYPSLRI